MLNKQSRHKGIYIAAIVMGTVFMLITTACGSFLVRSDGDDIVSGVQLIKDREADVTNEVLIGEVAEVHEFDVTVRAVRVTDGRNERVSAPVPPVGQLYLVADVLMENAGQEKTYVSSRMQFSLLDSDGEIQEWAFYPSKGSIDGRIDPGREKMGELAWVVDDDANGLKMVFGGTAFVLGDVSGYRSGSPDNQLTSMRQ